MKGLAGKWFIMPREKERERGESESEERVVIGCGLTPVKILFRLRLQKIYPRRNTTTTCEGTDHGLTPKLNIYTKI